MQFSELKEFLDAKSAYYNQPSFIADDPICIPHEFTRKEDQEIAGFLAAVIAWGNRKSILKSGRRMMEMMDYAPYEFVLNASADDLASLSPFVHRTFNGEDFQQFVRSLRRLYQEYGGLEGAFALKAGTDTMAPGISHFKSIFFNHPLDLQRSKKHLPDPLSGSAAKRINMFLRWMVRKDQCGVDLGIWTQITPSQLSCPLDIHVGRTARKLGLIQRKQDDAKALIELDCNLRRLDPKDPAKYDFALFGLGVIEKFAD